MLDQSHHPSRHNGTATALASARLQGAGAPPVDGAAFRQALSLFATGVTVITAAGPDGRIAALTANAFTSVSLDPPLILACIGQRSGALATLRAAGRFAVHILAADQDETARVLARRGSDKLDAVRFRRGESGAPVLDGCLARLDCDLAREYDGGDHAILLGTVTRIDAGNDGAPPLTFFRGQLGALG